MQQPQQGILAGPILRLILAKATPMLLGAGGVLLFNLVDTLFIARLGVEALAAISFTFPLTLLFSSLATGLSVALNTRLAPLLGANRQQKAQSLCSHALLISLLITTLLALLSLINVSELFLMLGAKLAWLRYIIPYMRIWLLAVPFLVLSIVACAIMRTHGDTLKPTQLMLCSALLNGLLDPLLIFGFGPVPALGVEGAALASALAWFITAMMALHRLNQHEKCISWRVLSLKQGLFQARQLSPNVTLVALSQALMPLASSAILALLATHGANAVAAYGIVIRIEAILLIGIMAINAIVPALVGQNLGAKQPQRAQQMVHYALRLAMAWQLLLALIIFMLAPLISAWLSPSFEVAKLCQYYLQVVPFCYAMMALPLILSHVLNTLSRPYWAMALQFVRLFLILLPVVAWSVFFNEVRLSFLAIMLAHMLGGLLSLGVFIMMMKTPRWWQ